MKCTKSPPSVHSLRWTPSRDCLAVIFEFQGQHALQLLHFLNASRDSLFERWDIIHEIIHRVPRLTFFNWKRRSFEANPTSFYRWNGDHAELRERVLSQQLGIQSGSYFRSDTPTYDISCRRNPHRPSQSRVYTAQDLFLSSGGGMYAFIRWLVERQMHNGFGRSQHKFPLQSKPCTHITKSYLF